MKTNLIDHNNNSTGMAEMDGGGRRLFYAGFV